MYASHQDAAILSYYSFRLGLLLENFYNETELSRNVIAYRALEKSNYDFSSEALVYAKNHSPACIIAMDVSKFYDTLLHSKIKANLKRILNTESLSEDWYRIFRFITDFHYIDLADLKRNPKFKPRFKRGQRGTIASIQEIMGEGVSIYKNPRMNERRGIPQGTPISANISNLYMMDFDVLLKRKSDSLGAFYRRYSDDILLICNPSEKIEMISFLRQAVSDQGLTVSENKTEVSMFDAHLDKGVNIAQAQYLGFNLPADGARIRASSMSKQFKKLHAAIRATNEKAIKNKKPGTPAQVFTKALRKKFSSIEYRQDGHHVKLRNFPSYARRSASAFGQDEKISRQLKRFERKADLLISKLKGSFKPKEP